MFVRRGDKAVEQSGNLPNSGAAVFHEALREKLGIGTATLGEFVADASFALADGGADELKRLILGDGAARLSGLKGSPGGKFCVEIIERGFSGRGESRYIGRGGRQGFEFADVIFRKLPKFLGADAAMFQMVFKESFDVYHNGTQISGCYGKAKPLSGKPLQSSGKG